MTDDILDLIDGALADYTSADAMRWSPEPETAEPVSGLMGYVTTYMRDAFARMEAEMAPTNPAPVAMMRLHTGPPAVAWESPYRMQPAMFYTASSPVPEWPRIDISFDVNVRPFLGAVETTVKQLRAVFLPFVRSAFERPARRPERLRRMHTAYARRARARRRR